MSGLIVRALVLVLLLATTGAGAWRIVDQEILHPGSTRASDALPLYLSAGAVAAGLDPTDQAALARVYDERGLDVGAATFSTLYPATAGALLEPVASLDWDGFSRLWRSILLGALLMYGVAAAWMAPGSWTTRLGWGLLVCSVLLWHPVSAECVRLGQVNMVLGALCALGIAAVRRGPVMLAAPVLALGALIKLVPGALILPVLAARRLGPVLLLSLLGIAGLGLAMFTVPLRTILEGVLGTLAFQAAIDPDWLVGRTLAPDWMRWLGFVRHDPLQWITLGAAIGIPALRPSMGTAAAGMALICAWLGADASGFHVLYVPLVFPAFLALSVGRGWMLAGLSAVFYGLPHLDGLAPEPQMVLFGLIVWVIAAAELLREAMKVPISTVERDGVLGPAIPTLAGLGVGWLLSHAWPAEGPVAPPLAEGQTTPEGPGFIRASDRVPGASKALGGGVDRPASTLARPGTIRAVQLHLRKAPVLWRELAAKYPARASLMEARADAAPAGELRELSGREVGAWLRDEQALVDTLRADGLELGDVPAGLAAAMASGLADPDLETRIPEP